MEATAMGNREAGRTDTLTLRIGDIAFRLTTGDSGLRLGDPGPSRLFIDNAARPDVCLEVVRDSAPSGRFEEKLFDSGVLWQLYLREDQHVFRFTSPVLGAEPYKTACLSSDFTRGEVRLRADCFEDSGPVNPLEYPLDELLMINLLARGRGAEVHGCGVVDTDGCGYLFLGQSGAGKTTMARQWTCGSDSPPRANGPEILSDDRIILRIIDGR